MRKWQKWTVGVVLLLVGSYCLLLIPDAEPPLPQIADAQPFVWDADGYWKHLEETFSQARERGCSALAPEIEDGLLRTDRLLQDVESKPVGPDAQVLGKLETAFFSLAPLLAACPAQLDRFVDLQFRVRQAVKRQSRSWDMKQRPARERVYRILYGTRAAVEEVLLQAGTDALPALQRATAEASATPSAKVLGMTVHSGDLLLSRGTAPTSALIARGSDFPGNFSHVALVHVDPETSIASIIEAHIERGVAVSSLADYLADAKARVTLLRIRADLPEMREEPSLPHNAAVYALERAQSGHIPYDFAMDKRDATRLYCSEVAYEAYQRAGLTLWAAESTVSSKGIAGWLAAFGVRHLTTLGPSDLEYDPQFSVVAEWRAPDALWRDHVDNAVVDALLEAAEAGRELRYSLPMLPVARLAKLASWVLVRLGHVGPVPEGMTATAALRNEAFSADQLALVSAVQTQAQAFHHEKGYRAPYWELVKMARKALQAASNQ